MIGLAAVVVIAVVHRKKTKRGLEPPGTFAEIEKTSPVPPEAPVIHGPAPDTPVVDAAPAAGSTVHVRFTAIGPQTFQIDLQIPENREIILGRDQRADIVLNPNDPKLSGRHCRVICQGKTLRVWDAGSSNGTSVDGIPLTGNTSAVLYEGQTLWVGDYQYRIQFPDG